MSRYEDQWLGFLFSCCLWEEVVLINLRSPWQTGACQFLFEESLSYIILGIFYYIYFNFCQYSADTLLIVPSFYSIYLLIFSVSIKDYLKSCSKAFTSSYFLLPYISNSYILFQSNSLSFCFYSFSIFSVSILFSSSPHCDYKIYVFLSKSSSCCFIWFSFIRFYLSNF